MNTIIARPERAAGTGTEPEPQHDRDTNSNPDRMPPLPRRDPGRALWQTDANRGLHRLVRHLCDDGDKRAARRGRRARRTLGEMRPEMSRPETSR